MIFRARRTSLPGLTPMDDIHDGCDLVVNTADHRAWLRVDGQFVELITVDPQHQEAAVEQFAAGVAINPPRQPKPRGFFERVFDF